MATYSPKERLVSIQILRAIACSLVLICHATDLSDHFGKSHLFSSRPQIANAGAAGVDLFFVISGFIVVYVTRQASGLKDSFRFLFKRFIRIFPAYILLYLTLYLLRFASFPSLYHFINNLSFGAISLVSESYYNSPLISPAWSLLYEFIFYVYAAVLILIPGKRIKLIISLCFIAAVILNHKPGSTLISSFLLNGIFIEFMMGVLLGIAYQRYDFSYNPLPGYSLIVFSVLLFIYLHPAAQLRIDRPAFITDNSMTLLRSIVWGIPSLIFVSGMLLCIKQEEQSLWKKTLRLTGDASYVIYLSHFIVFYCIKNFARELPLNGTVIIIIAFFLASFIGIAFHLLVDKPVQQLLRRKSLAD